jgi:hypothetical protein
VGQHHLADRQRSVTADADVEPGGLERSFLVCGQEIDGRDCRLPPHTGDRQRDAVRSPDGQGLGC